MRRPCVLSALVPNGLMAATTSSSINPFTGLLNTISTKTILLETPSVIPVLRGITSAVICCVSTVKEYGLPTRYCWTAAHNPKESGHSPPSPIGSSVTYSIVFNMLPTDPSSRPLGPLQRLISAILFGAKSKTCSKLILELPSLSGLISNGLDKL